MASSKDYWSSKTIWMGLGLQAAGAVGAVAMAAIDNAPAEWYTPLLLNTIGLAQNWLRKRTGTPLHGSPADSMVP